MTHRQIAAELHIGTATAYRHVTRALAKVHEQTAEEATTLRALEASRLDELQFAIWERAIDGDGAAISKVLAIMERRAKLLGLDEPLRKETKVTAPDPQDAKFRRELLIKQVLGDAMSHVAESS